MKKGVLFALLMAFSQVVLAYPDKPIKLIVPFPPGSITDVVARIVAGGMSPELGKPVVVENKAGANGIVGTAAAVKAPADGYHLLMVGVSTGASNVSAFKSLPYDPRKDFTSIGLIADAPFMLVTNKNLPVKTIGDLIEYSKQSEKPVFYGYGSGSAQLCAAKVVSMGKLKATAVAYRGVPQAMTDLIGGSLDFTIADMVNGVQQSKAGKVTALGVTSKERSSLAPDVPTLNEAGLKGYDLKVWFGMAAPEGVPDPIVQQLNQALKNVLASESVLTAFTNNGLAPRYSTAPDFSSLINMEIEKWGTVFSDAGLTPQ